MYLSLVVILSESIQSLRVLEAGVQFCSCSKTMVSQDTWAFSLVMAAAE
jgi:hypothetical protein